MQTHGSPCARAGGDRLRDAPPFATVAEWLAWQESLNSAHIELGLARVAEVLSRMPAAGSPALTLLVGGTNGKGSCTAYLSAMLGEGGFRVGTYSSPHLLRYHERIRIDAHEIDDAGLLAAFAEVEAARNGVALTYFEYGTLAALAAFAQAGCTARVLEVGLGGRLDAVNAVEPDGSLVVSVALDHLDWLGPDRESIGFEKAGIFRAARPAVCADPDPPVSLLAHAQRIGARLIRTPQDYRAVALEQTWRYESAYGALEGLPMPPLAGRVQLGNAAASVALLEACLGSEALPRLTPGLQRARLPGRFQVHRSAGIEWVLDVAHNPAAAAALAETLTAQPGASRTRCIFGILDTKDVVGVLAALRPCIDEWLLVATDSRRALAPTTLAEALAEAGGGRASLWSDVRSACRSAADDALPGERIVVAGSFHTVGPALELLGLS